ncbi:MAG: tripartite tricarboxylate transporter substrate binding protein [Burkholderiales bacterium]|nr:tripartite tricarboxylate transporter substrate binding protein [Burkholderiales bacterium]
MLRLLTSSFILLALCAQANAQPAPVAYPSQPIRLVVPTGAGGITDQLARILGKNLSDVLKQPVIIDNKPGASGSIGSSLVAMAKPDGYTLLMAFPSHVANPNTMKNLPYDTIKDFSPVTKVGLVNLVLLVQKDGPIKDVKGLIDAGRRKPEALSYGSVGAGSLAHVGALVFQEKAGLKMVHVPYKSEPDMIVALMRNDIQAAFVSPAAALPMLRAGRVKALGIASATRSPALPELETIASAGLPGFEVTGWNAIFAPAGTPAAIVSKLNAAANQVLRSPEVSKQFLELGVPALGSTPEELQQSLVKDIESIGKTLTAVGVFPQ